MFQLHNPQGQQSYPDNCFRPDRIYNWSELLHPTTSIRCLDMISCIATTKYSLFLSFSSQILPDKIRPYKQLVRSQLWDIWTLQGSLRSEFHCCIAQTATNSKIHIVLLLSPTVKLIKLEQKKIMENSQNKKRDHRLSKFVPLDNPGMQLSLDLQTTKKQKKIFTYQLILKTKQS